MAGRLTSPARFVCSAAVAGLLVGGAYYATTVMTGTFGSLPLPAAAFAAFGGAVGRFGYEAESGWATGAESLRRRYAVLLVVVVTLLFELALGAFLGAGKTARPDRISLPDGVVYGVLVVAAAGVAFSVGRLVAMSRAGRISAYGGALVFAAICGAMLGIGLAAGFGLLRGSPCLPYQHCSGLEPSVWSAAAGLVPLASLSGLGLGVAACVGILVGQLPFLRPLALV